MADETVDVTTAAGILEVQPEQIQAMVDEGLLTPLDGHAETTFSAAEVRAAKNLGG